MNQVLQIYKLNKLSEHSVLNVGFTIDGCSGNLGLTKQQFKERIGMTQKQFTKADLKDGMFVRLNFDNSVYLKVDDYLISHNGFMRLGAYNDNLEKPDDSWSVNEVMALNNSEINLGAGLRDMKRFNYKSIWKRPTKPKKTPEQLEIEKIQAEMEQLNKRLGELKEKM